MPSILENTSFPIVAQADQVVSSAMEAYRALEEYSRASQGKTQLAQELNEIHARIDALVQNGLSTQFLPIREMAIQASTWSTISEQCTKTQDNTDRTNFLISQCLSYESQLQGVVSEYDLQKKYWDSQASRRSTLEVFLGPEEKTGWDLELVQIAMRDVMSHYYSALSEAKATNYVDAIPPLDRAWSQYQKYEQINDGMEARQEAFEELPSIEKARTCLRQLARWRLDDGLDPNTQKLLEGFHSQSADLQKQLDQLAMRVKKSELHEETIDPAEINACVEQIETLQARYFALRKPSNKEQLLALGVSNAELIRRYTQLFMGQKEYPKLLKDALSSTRAAWSALDGTGFDQEQIQAFQERLVAIEQESEELFRSMDEHIKTVQTLEKQIHSVTSEQECTERTQKVEQEEEALNSWKASMQTPLNACAGLMDELSSAQTSQDQVLAENTQNIQECIKKLEKRIANYKNHSPPIPAEFRQEREENIQSLLLLSEVQNQQAQKQVLDNLNTYIAGGQDSDFPTAAQAMALFDSAMTPGRTIWQSMTFSDNIDKEAKRLLDETSTFDFVLIKNRAQAFEAESKKSLPGWNAALKTNVAQLEDLLKKHGPKKDSVFTKASKVLTEITMARELCPVVPPLLKQVEQKKEALDELLQQLTKEDRSGIIGFLRGAGSALITPFIDEEEYKGPEEKERVRLLSIISQSCSIEQISQAIDDLQTLIVAYDKLLSVRIESGEMHPVLDAQNKVSKEEEAKRKEQEKKDKEWSEIKKEYKKAYAEAKKADAPKFERNRLKELFASLQKNKNTQFEQSKKQGQFVIDRLKQLKENPEGLSVIGKGQLTTLAQDWKSATQKYQQAISKLCSEISTQGSGDESTQGAAVIKKIEQVQHIFAMNIFDESVFLLTTDKEIPLEERRAARERGLAQIREYKRILDGHPLMPQLLWNPFSPVPTGELFRILNNLELQYVKSV